MSVIGRTDLTREDRARISWDRNTETRYPYGAVSPAPDRLEPLGFPPPWSTRPWIYSNLIASRNGVVAWKRAGSHDDPVRAIAGGDFSRPGRLADRQLMRHLRACADAVSMGAETLRAQPNLIATPGDTAGELGEHLDRWRATHNLRPLPLQVVYSEEAHLDLDTPIFNTPELAVIVVTTEVGARRLRRAGSDEKGATLLVAGGERIDSSGLVRAHERLFEEFGVRYVDCEGGMTILGAFRRAGILDEVFVTVTDVHIEPSEHEDIKRLFDLKTEAASLIAEGRTAQDAGYVFRRWRFNER